MNKTILLIEDNNEIRENTTEILELANYTVHTASNGKEGVEMASKELPNLIICDIMMPILDGYGVIYLLSKNEKTASIPFIFLTAKADRNDFRKAMDMGADDYLTKPFDDIELLNAVESRLRKSEVLKKEFSKNVVGLNEFFHEAKGLESLKKLSVEQDLKFYKKKEDIYKLGGYPKGVFFISTGKIKTFKINDEGKELITGLYKEGDFFGYLALLDESKYTDSAMALDDSEIYIIPKNGFISLIYKSPEVSKKFIKILSDNLAEKEDHLIQLAYNSVRKRVAEALVTIQKRYQNENEKENNFSINLSREDLANMAGTSTETAIRTLSNFKEEQLIEIKGGIITIIDYEKLVKMRN